VKARGMKAFKIPAAIALAASLLAGGCMVGPDFQAPPLPAEAGFLPEPFPARTEAANSDLGQSQQIVPGKEISAAWWKLFHCAGLNRVIERAFAANPNIQAAQASLRAAMANARAQEGALFPTAGVDFNPTRQQTPSGSLASSASSGASIYSLYTLQANVSYTLDVFGGVRRSMEALDAQTDFQRYELQAAYLTLAGNTATAAVQEASLRAQIEATVEMIHIEREILGLMRQQTEKGQIPGVDVVAQETALAQSELTLPPLHKQLAQQQHQLSVLAGNFPNEPAGTFKLGDMHLPRVLPDRLPSQLVQQRPDIKAAEAEIHSASALVGVAVANRLPNLTLSGSYGASSLQIEQIFLPQNRLWSIGGNVAQTIFDAGTLEERQRAAEAAYDQAGAAYRATVLTAFQNVADALRAIQYDASALAAAARAERSGSEYLQITRQRLQLGAVNYLVLLSAEQTYQQARLALIQAQAARLTDTIVLFQALGGGWWLHDRELPGPAIIQR
jgi:NodT family efflux transporter outer membrane factor (OMF) lipoprotein